MGKTELFATLWTGAGVFGASAIVTAIVLAFFVVYRRGGPGRFTLASCVTLFFLYTQFGTDWSAGFYMRPDGVQPSAARCVANVLIYALQSMVLASACHLGYQDGKNVVLIGASAGVLFGLADVASDGVGWLPWAFGLGAIFWQQLLVGIKSGSNDWRAISAYAVGAITFFFPLPLCQALSWTMGGVIDGDYINRENAEIFYLIVYTFGVPLWNWWVMFTYERLPEERRRNDWLEHAKAE